jgi:hypothetical protein
MIDNLALAISHGLIALAAEERPPACVTCSS